MKILIVLYYYHPYVSGLSLLAKTLAEGLVARGHTVTVLTTQYDNSLPGQEVLNGVDVIRAKVLGKLGKGLVSFDFLTKIIGLSKKHDVINPHLPMAHFGFVLPFIDHSKLIPQYHCDLNLGSGIAQGFVERISYWSMGRTLQKSPKIIATTMDYFSHCHFKAQADRVCEIYPPIDHSRFQHRGSSELRAKLGIAKSTKLVGFVGRVVAEKGIEYLLQAIPLLEKRLDDFQVLIAGNYLNVAGGSVKDKVDAIAQKFPGRVMFVGQLKFDDLVTFYSMVDVLVLPSVDPLEAFGMVQVEAMLCGTPVVASDMPGVREVVRKTGFGRLVKPRDPGEIADKVYELLMEPVKVRREALADFKLEYTMDKYLEAFS